MGAKVETTIAGALRQQTKAASGQNDSDLFRKFVERVDVHADELIVTTKRRAGSTIRPKIRVAWKKPPSKQKREILLPSAPVNSSILRPMRSDARERLIKAIAQGRQWLNKLIAGEVADTVEIAIRERCSVRSVNMTVSLAFLAPSLVKATIEGTLPRGVTYARLCELPAEWSQQYRALGLTPQT